MKRRIILKVAQLRQPNLLEVKMMCDEGQLEVPEERPGVLDSDGVVGELDVGHNDLDQGLLPLDGGQHCPVLGVEDDPVTLDTLGKQLHRQTLELIALLKQLLEMITDEVDAVLKQLLEAELICQLEDGHTVGHVQVPNHELDAAHVELPGLQVVGRLQQVLDIVYGDVGVASVQGLDHYPQSAGGHVHVNTIPPLIPKHSLQQ